MAVISRHNRLVQITRVAAHGTGLCVVMNKQVRDMCQWNQGDSIAVRQCGDMLLFERVNLNEYAKLRTGLPEARPEKFAGKDATSDNR